MILSLLLLLLLCNCGDLKDGVGDKSIEDDDADRWMDSVGAAIC